MSSVLRASSATANPSAANRRASAAPLPGPTPTTAQTGFACFFPSLMGSSSPTIETRGRRLRITTMASARSSRARRFALALLALCTTLATAAGSAYACGAGAGGAAGISGCSLAEHDEEMRPKWRVGAAYSFTSTGLHFGGGLRVDEVRSSSLVAVDYLPTRRVTLEAGAGPFLGGSITTPTARYPLAPGLVTGIGGSWRVLDADGAIPFVLLTANLSYVSSSAPQDIGYNAFDLRLGAAVGTTFWRVLTPYVVGRAFGGPVYWRYLGTPVVGTDDHHWQVGAGLSVRLGRKVDLFAEGVPLGELGVTAGAGVSF